MKLFFSLITSFIGYSLLAQQLCFTPPNNFLTGAAAKSVCTGDFNGDGKKDLAVCIVSTHSIAIFLGNGSGGFSAPVSYPCNTQPYGVCTNDFNGDNKADLAVANNGSFQGMSVLLGNGAGGFGSPTSYAAGTNPTSIATADFNNDNKKDVVVSNRNSSPGTVSVFLGTGSGTFNAPSTYTVGSAPVTVIAVDVNNANGVDLITANTTSQNITVLLNNGSGSFFSAGNFTVGAGTVSPIGICAADFNNDNKIDVATANSATSNVSVLLGQGNGQFLGPNTFGAGNSPQTITNGDYDGDGIKDLAVCNSSGVNVSVLRGNGVGGFNTAVNFATDLVPVSIVTDDFNGDSKPDLVTANNSSTAQDVSVLLNSLPGPITISGNVVVCAGKPITLSAAGASNYSWSTGATTTSIVITPTSSGSYSVSGTNPSCTVTATKTEIVATNPLPTVLANASTNTVTLCTNTSITLTGGGAQSYVWSSGILNGVGFILSTTSTYTVTGTDANSCSNTATTTITMVQPAAPSICLVTVDSISKYNIIAWEKTAQPVYDSMLIFRETSTNIYKQIGSVSYDSLSWFIDTVRTKYFPNTGNPNSGTYRYKIQLRDTCGNISAMSNFHNTIFITNNSGNFSWPQLYTIENSANPVNNYVLMRDDFSTGVWDTLGNVAGTQQSISDTAYATFQATASWRVITKWSITCGLSIKNPIIQASNLNLSKSNVNKVAGPTGMFNESALVAVAVFPNPTSGIFQVRTNDYEGLLEIYSVYGKKVFTTNTSRQARTEIDLNQEAVGVYYLKFTCPVGISISKIIKK